MTRRRPNFSKQPELVLSSSASSLNLDRDDIALMFTAAFKILAGAVILAMSTLPGSASVLAPRSDGSIFMCTDANSGGTCATVDFTFEVCSSIPAVINDAVSSLQTPRGTLCTIYADGGCSGHFIHIVGPGEPNLGNNNFNDQMSSFICIPGC